MKTELKIKWLYEDTDLGISAGDHINTNVNNQLSDALEFSWASNFVTTHLTKTNDDLLDKLGYGVHDLYLQCLSLNDDALKLTLSVSNLFDKEHRVQSTFGETIYGDAGNMSPGRDFRIILVWVL